MLKFIAIASLAAVVGTAYATPQRKRIENKYITNVDEQQKSPLAGDPYLGLTNRKLEKDESMSMHHDDDHDHDMMGKSYCTYSPDKTCYATGWPACCEDEDTCPEERPECDVEYDQCADFDTLKAAEKACTEEHECGELEDVNFGPDCAGNKEEHCAEIKACSECEEEIRAMFDCEHGEKCGEGLGTCEDDHDGDHDHDEDGHKDDEHTSEDGHDGHDHGEDGETDHSDDMDKDAAASTDSGAATLTAGAALLGGVALMMA